MSVSILGLMAISLVSSLISAGISTWSAQQNVQAQKDINAQNVNAQQAINNQNVQAQQEINRQNIDYSKEYAQNQIQWKMQDLEAAGLNPTMAAGSSLGGTYSPGVLSAPHQAAAKQQAPFMDMSGVSSAMMAASNMMLTAYLMQGRNDIMSDRNDVMSDKNNILNGLYRRKAAYFDSGEASKFGHSAQQVSKVWTDSKLNKTWNKMLKELDDIK